MLTLEDALKAQQMKDSYNNSRRPYGTPPPAKENTKPKRTVTIKTRIGQDPETKEWRLMTD